MMSNADTREAVFDSTHFTYFLDLKKHDFLRFWLLHTFSRNWRQACCSAVFNVFHYCDFSQSLSSLGLETHAVTAPLSLATLKIND